MCVAGLSTYQLSYLNLSFTNNLQNQAYHGILAEYMRLIPTCEKNQYGVRGARYPVSKKSLFWAFFGVFIISSLKTWRVLSQKVLNLSQLNYNFSAWIRSISRFYFLKIRYFRLVRASKLNWETLVHNFFSACNTAVQLSLKTPIFKFLSQFTNFSNTL